MTWPNTAPGVIDPGYRGARNEVASMFKWDQPSRVDVKRAKETEAEARWRRVCKVVDQRDGRMCRCCDKWSDPEATGLFTRGHRHHIIYKSAGGADESWNLLTLCAKCHSDEHRNKLRLTGLSDHVDANEGVTFWRKDERGMWCVVREEIAVRQIRRD